MKYVGPLEDYNPQAQYETMKDGRSQRLVMAATHTFDRRDVIKLVEQCLQAGIIQPTDLPLKAASLLTTAAAKAEHEEGLDKRDYEERLLALARSVFPRFCAVTPTEYQVVAEDGRLPSMKYHDLERANIAAQKHAENNGKATMVVIPVTRYNVRKVVEEA